MCVFASGREREQVVVKVAVKETEEVEVLTDAIKMLRDQSWVNSGRICRPPRTATRPDNDRGSRGARLTNSSPTKESFARDCNDRLLSE